MAEKDDSKGTTNKLLWVIGSASVTAAAFYFVQRHLNEREELNRLRYMENQKKIEGGD